MTTSLNHTFNHSETIHLSVWGLAGKKDILGWGIPRGVSEHWYANLAEETIESPSLLL